MSEIRDDLSDQEQPLLTVDFDLSRAYYEKGLRYSMVRKWARGFCLLLVLLFVLYAGMDLYYAITQNLPYLELLKGTFTQKDPIIWLLYIAIFLVYAIKYLVIQPAQMMKKTSGLFGSDGKCRLSYVFGEQLVRCVINGKNSDARQDINYADITRVKNRKYDLLLRTNQKTALSIYKEGLTAEDEQRILSILKARCPQVRSLQDAA